MFIAEINSIREDLRSNIMISMFQHYWILGTGCFVFFQAFASFRYCYIKKSIWKQG